MDRKIFKVIMLINDEEVCKVLHTKLKIEYSF